MFSVWNKRTTTRLEKLVSKGKSATTIGEALGLTKDAVISKCRRLGLRLAGSRGPLGSKGKIKTSKRNVLPAKGV